MANMKELKLEDLDKVSGGMEVSEETFQNLVKHAEEQRAGSSVTWDTQVFFDTVVKDNSGN